MFRPRDGHMTSSGLVEVKEINELESKLILPANSFLRRSDILWDGTMNLLDAVVLLQQTSKMKLFIIILS